MTLREQFEKETETPWENSQGEPDIDYVIWLETKIQNTSSNNDEARKEERERCARLCNKLATEARTKIQTSFCESIKNTALCEAGNKYAEAIRKMVEI